MCYFGFVFALLGRNLDYEQSLIFLDSSSTRENHRASRLLEVIFARARVLSNSTILRKMRDCS